MNTYTIVFEPPVTPGGNWSAYVPDVPGCVGVGATREKCRESVEVSFGMYAEDYRERGVPLPAPSVVIETLEFAA